MKKADDGPIGERKAAADKAKLVLTTSLGVALIANLAFVPSAQGGTTPVGTGDAKLVEWSSDAVKAYYDANMDWSLALPTDKAGASESPQPSSTPEPSTGGAASGGGGGGTTNVYHGGGFGWDDLLLYHLLFNRGGGYSSNQWYSGHNVAYAGTKRSYSPQSFDAGKFQNKPVPNSQVAPKTSNSTGSIVRRSTSGSGVGTSTGKSTSSSSGSIGGKSSGFSSSGSSSSGS